MNIQSKLHGCGTWHAPNCGIWHGPNCGKDVEGSVYHPYRTYAIHVPLLPAQSIWLARRKGLQLLSSLLYYFSLLYLDRPSTGAEVGRFEHFVFLFLALVCRGRRGGGGVVSVLGDSNFF